MELKTFISQSIKDIFDAVIDAQEYAKQKGGNVNVYQDDCIRRIDYDIAVTISTSKAGGGKAKAKILIVEAGLGVDIKNEHSTLSRLKFPILVEMPYKVWIEKGHKPTNKQTWHGQKK